MFSDVGILGNYTGLKEFDEALPLCYNTPKPYFLQGVTGYDSELRTGS